MKYIIELSDDEMEKVKNSHKALFIDVYRMMANTLIKGIPFDSVLEDIKVEVNELSPITTAEDVIDGNIIKDVIWETLIDVDKIIDKYISGKENNDEKV